MSHIVRSLLAMTTIYVAAISQTQYASSYDSVRIAYTDKGKGDIALVFVHGWSCDRTYWAAQVNAFARSYRVVTIDLAGHGESGSDRMWWSMEGFGEDIASVMDTLNLNNVVLVGHSAAGYSCLEAARLRPVRVIGLVGVDAYRFIAKGYFDRYFSLREIERSAASMRHDFSGQMESLVRTRFFSPNAKAELVDWVAKDMASAPPSVAIPSGTYAFTLYRRDYLKHALREVGARIPIFAINQFERGQIDPSVFQEHAPRFTVTYIPEVGHFLMMEKPDVFNAELTRILKEIEPNK
jgi:pimeloyl-ACP methyl ester carboxylesterase